jgi:chemotaxis methyl-accepting protein methylase
VSFAELSRLVEQRLGVNLGRAGLDEALRRFAERSIGTGPWLAGDDRLESAGVQALVEAVTVQHSWLFRDQQQLEAACSLLRHGEGSRPPSCVWVTACATGEEAYSLLAICERNGTPIDLLGTDVNAAALTTAQRARYLPASTRAVPACYQSALVGAGSEQQIAPHLRARRLSVAQSSR